MKPRHYPLVLLMLISGGAATSLAEEAPLPETCYIFTHFYWTGETGMHLAWSRDGLEWELLNDGEGVILPMIGESRLMRDPSVVRGGDGRFHMVWTTSWSGQTIGYASSDDLVNWGPQQLIPVMEHEPLAQNCWAPEIHYIPDEQLYLILWSTTLLGEFPETALSNRRFTRNHRIYYTTTTDFETFTPTELYYDGGYNVIDAALIQEPSGEWLMFVKNETYSPQVEKNIRLVRGRTWRGPFSAPSDSISGDYWAEGPSPIYIDGELHVFFDKHDVGRYGVVKTTDTETWEDLSDRTRFPEHVRHGTFLAVPGTFMKDLLNKHP